MRIPLPPLARSLAEDLGRGRISRREFLGYATAFGLGAQAALTLAGQPTRAQAQSAPPVRQGGALRIQHHVKVLDDPRLFAWNEMANLTRGFLEYLVEYQPDGSFRGMLVDRWEVNADATRYVLHLRQGVRWNNGDAFTAEDVRRNIARWCDSTLDGNSMAIRMIALIDPGSGQMRDDAVQIPDPATVTLQLSQPDITLIANMADYPAAIVHQSYAGGDPFANGIGTGPFRPVEIVPGSHATLERATDHDWWGTAVHGGPYLDRVEFLDLGTDPSDWAEAARADRIDLIHDSVGDFIDIMSGIGWQETSTESAATVVIRSNQQALVGGTPVYADVRLRRALQRVVDNQVCLELGYGGRGTPAANTHVSPLQPGYVDIGPPEYDPKGALQEMIDLNLHGIIHELVTLDDEWQRNTGDAVAALINDAGLACQRKVLPGKEFWANWKSFPFSATAWNHRPLEVQVLALSYRSGAAWNETGFSNPEFDQALDQAMAYPDAERRKPVIRRLEEILRQEGVIIQPYWRTLFSHHNGRLAGAEKHPTNEIRLYQISFLEDPAGPVPAQE